MKYIYKSLTIIILVFFTNQLQAQTTEIDFNLTSSSISFMGQNIAISSTLNKSGSLLTWNQQANNTSEVTDFTILSTVENWNEENSEGDITYTMIVDELQCVFVLSGNTTGLSAELTLTSPAANVETYIFNIDTISYQ